MDTVDKLIRAGLLEEGRANGSLLAWRRDVETGPMALRINTQPLRRKFCAAMGELGWVE